jgi:class 3 adenylate cyclase
VLREVGGAGHVAYPLVGDTINTAARLESAAPEGSVLIADATYERLPEGTVVSSRRLLALRGKQTVTHAYVLLALP